MGRTRAFPSKGAHSWAMEPATTRRAASRKAGGEITGDDSLKREGEVDKASAARSRTPSAGVSDKVKDVVGKD